MENQNLTYEIAYNELLEISQEIESETISVDLLADKIKRAAFLVDFCQKKLKSTENEVDNIIEQMEKKI